MGRDLEKREAVDEGLGEVTDDKTEAQDEQIADLVCGAKPAEQTHIHIDGIIDYVKQKRQRESAMLRHVSRFLPHIHLNDTL